MWRYFAAGVCALILGIEALPATRAAAGLDPAFPQSLLGPEHANGVVVWNHGRSITVEDSESPTPPFLQVVREGGWDILRFDRPRDGDTLTDSTRRLVENIARLKRQGYRHVVLAGQSFGAFLVLMAADPVLFEQMVHDPIGKDMIAFAIVAQIIGFLVMRKIVNFKV